MGSKLRQRELKGEISCQELNVLGFSNENIGCMVRERIQEIREYTGESPPIVAYKINSSLQDAIALWDELKPKNEEELLQFHSQTMRKVYSAITVCGCFFVIREKILRRILGKGKPASILDFGGGRGDLTIAAAKAGLDVTYADIGFEVRRFAQWRAEKENLKIYFTPVESNRCVFTNNTYDYIICLDVVSHLPNLSQYLGDFHSCLKDNGEFFLGDDLYDFLVPWHLNENEIYTDPNKKRELFKDFKFVEHLWANCDVWRKQ